MKDIRGLLVYNGHIQRIAQMKSQSLSPAQRRIILANREKAYQSGYNWSKANAVEFCGVLGEPLPSGKLVEAVFAYEDLGAFGIKKRMYNVSGLHFDLESTLDCADLFKKKVLPNDMNYISFTYHAFKSFLSNSLAEVEIFWLDRKEFILTGLASLRSFVKGGKGL